MASATSGAAGGRIEQLDALRGIAAVVVVIHHLIRRFYEDYGRPPGSIPYLPFDGMDGVYLFFIISGFVISQTLNRVKSGRDFFVSRFSRIVPSFWFAVVLTFAVVRIFGLPGRAVSLGAALVNLTMLEDHVRVDQVDSVYWSLTMELSFYVIAYVAQSRGWLARHPFRFAWAWLGYSAAVAVARFGFGYHLPENIKLLTLPEYAPLFVAGIMFFLMYSGRVSVQMHVIIATSFVLHNVHAWGGKVGTAIVASFYVVFYLLVLGRLGFLRARPLLFFGAISYPLYLLHNNIGMVVIRGLMKLGVPYNAALVATLGSIVALATAVTRYVEKPAMRWLRGRLKKKVPVAAEAGVA